MNDDSWTEPEGDVREFLDEYDRRGAEPDGQAHALFADAFLSLDPNSAYALTPAQIEQALPARRKMFEDASTAERSPAVTLGRPARARADASGWRSRCASRRPSC